MHRRHFLKASALLAGTGLVGSDLVGQKLFGQSKDFIDNGDGEARPYLTCYPDTQDGKHQLHQLWVRKNNAVLTSYRAHPSQKYLQQNSEPLVMTQAADGQEPAPLRPPLKPG